MMNTRGSPFPSHDQNGALLSDTHYRSVSQPDQALRFSNVHYAGAEWPAKSLLLGRFIALNQLRDEVKTVIRQARNVLLDGINTQESES
jgi:hypothetical protein